MACQRLSSTAETTFGGVLLVSDEIGVFTLICDNM